MHCLDVIIETPKGSTEKYDYDPSSAEKSWKLIDFSGR
jgi:hypothetical protein